ncbi:MAG: hypothetical protein JWL70_1161 [Acidimicrobiia bacterium]|nr:hypothetical protein [Acidimicrobiia bacterium]
MKHSMRGRAQRAAVALAVAVPAMVGLTATGASARPARTIITVQGSDAGVKLSGSNPRHAGTITFNVSSTAKGGTNFQLIQLRHGITPAQAQADAAKLNGESVTPADVQAIERDVLFLGGIDVQGGQSGSFTEILNPGHYYALDVNSDTLQPFTLVGSVGRSLAPAVSATVTAQEHHFDVTGPLPAHGNILFRNRNDEPHFLIIQHVKDGTTDAQIQAVFDKAANGQQPSDADTSILLPEGIGSGVVSFGYQELLHLDLPAGTYDLECFWPDDATGMPHAFMGMHKIVQVA